MGLTAFNRYRREAEEASKNAVSENVAEVQPVVEAPAPEPVVEVKEKKKLKEDK